MSCPSCGHTMHRLGCQFAGDRTVCRGSYWCPRCGTLIVEDVVTAPALVRRCREIESTLTGHCAVHMFEWKRQGIAEAIHVQEERPI